MGPKAKEQKEPWKVSKSAEAARAVPPWNFASPAFDIAYLREAGTVDLLPKWRKLASAALSSTGVVVH